MKVDILAFGAHPDDIELGCGGSLAKAVAQGKKVGLIDLTQGELGTRGSAEIRKRGATEAAKLLNASFRKNLGFRDGFFVNDEAHQLEVIKTIRAHQPKIVLCNAIDDRHIDHAKGSQLVSDACFLSGLKNCDQRQQRKHTNRMETCSKGLSLHSVERNYTQISYWISRSILIKLEVIQAYSSQVRQSNKELLPTKQANNFFENVDIAATMPVAAGANAARLCCGRLLMIA